MTDPASWMLLGASILFFAIYESWVLWTGRRHPERMARYAHARMRVAWVASLKDAPGTEITAVQALRNSLMSATIAASTAALALMGSVSLAGISLASGIAHLGQAGGITVHTAIEGLLMCVLFASYVCSSTAMRYYNHAGFVMSMPVGSAERAQWMPLAISHVERAGILYSWGLRCFLMVAPLVAGIVNPSLMPAMTLGLVVVLWFFDQAATVRPETLRTRSTDRA